METNEHEYYDEEQFEVSLKNQFCAKCNFQREQYEQEPEAMEHSYYEDETENLDENLEKRIANQEKQLPARPPNVHFDEFNEIESIQYEEYM